MADVQSDRWFTPADIRPLGLDLATLAYFSSFPATFEGRTHEGKEIYCRYQYGWLRIRIARTVEGEADRDSIYLFDQRIGPPYDAELTLGQLCHYAGITINGVRPPVDGPLDLGSTTTFYDAFVYSTVETARFFIDQVLKNVGDASVIQLVHNAEHKVVGGIFCDRADEISYGHPLLVCGPRPSKQEISDYRRSSDLDGPGTIEFRIIYEGFSSSFRLRPQNLARSEQFSSHWRSHYAREIFVPWETEEWLTASFSLRTSFPAEDAAKRSRVAAIDAILDVCCPPEDLLAYDLGTDERCADKDRKVPLDPRVKNWVLAGRNRWHSIINEGTWEEPNCIGYLPRSG